MVGAPDLCHRLGLGWHRCDVVVPDGAWPLLLHGGHGNVRLLLVVMGGGSMIVVLHGSGEQCSWQQQQQQRPDVQRPPHVRTPKGQGESGMEAVIRPPHCLALLLLSHGW